jgi:hypothetical protein
MQTGLPPFPRSSSGLALRSINGALLALATAVVLLLHMNPLLLLSPILAGPVEGLRIWIAGGLLPAMAIVSAWQFWDGRRYLLSWIAFTTILTVHFSGPSYRLISDLRP